MVIWGCAFCVSWTGRYRSSGNGFRVVTRQTSLDGCERVLALSASRDGRWCAAVSLVFFSMVSSPGKAGRCRLVRGKSATAHLGSSGCSSSLRGMEYPLYKHSPCPAKDGCHKFRLECEPLQLWHSASPARGGRPHPNKTPTKRTTAINTPRRRFGPYGALDSRAASDPLESRLCCQQPRKSHATSDTNSQHRS